MQTHELLHAQVRDPPEFCIDHLPAFIAEAHINRVVQIPAMRAPVVQPPGKFTVLVLFLA